MIFSVVSYSVNRRRRDFTSINQVLATRYAIIAESAHVERARSVLGVDAPSPTVRRPHASTVTATPGRPMSYGEATDAARRAAAPAASSAPVRPRYGEMAPSEDEAEAAAADRAASGDHASDDDATTPSSPER
jgi:hypothetical protein